MQVSPLRPRRRCRDRVAESRDKTSSRRTASRCRMRRPLPAIPADGPWTCARQSWHRESRWMTLRTSTARSAHRPADAFRSKRVSPSRGVRRPGSRIRALMFCGWLCRFRRRGSSPRTPVHEPLVSLLQANHKWWNRFLTNPFDQSES